METEIGHAFRILVIEDDPAVASGLRAGLEREGYAVSWVDTGATGIDHAREQNPHLILLDVRLPDLSGLDVCRRLRQLGLRQPIVMLTVRDQEIDKVLGLEMGADDYVTKPFSPREIVARVRAVLRRVQPESHTSQVLRIGAIELDRDEHQVTASGHHVDLTPTEFDLLEVLMSNPGRAFSRMDLLERLQGEAYSPYERTIDAHIKNLRAKIEPEPAQPQYILTVFGVGYKMAKDEEM